MARRPNPALHALWRDRVRRQSISGLTIEQFCAPRAVCQVQLPSMEAPFPAHGPARSVSCATRSLNFPARYRTPCRERRRPASSYRGRPSQRNPPSYPNRERPLGLSTGPLDRRSQDRFRRLEMISLPHSVRVFLHAPATDLRKGFDALSGLVTTAFGQDPTLRPLVLVCESASGPTQDPLLGS